MYAVFQIGTKQYRVFYDQIIYIERVKVNIGDHIEFDQVLFVKDNKAFKIGDPFIEKMKIIAKVLDHSRNQKIRITKFRRRKHYRKSQGHRQYFTKIKIMNIGGVVSEL